ncbi:unnamed protein product [Rhodiola kirilowii]
MHMAMVTLSCWHEICVCAHQSPCNGNQLFLSEVYLIQQYLTLCCAYWIFQESIMTLESINHMLKLSARLCKKLRAPSIDR